MIEFILNHKTIKTDCNPGMTLLDFVRYEQQLTGTKIGCREGDCGACTVLIGTLNQKGDTVHYHSITSCISPLGNARGKHVVTVEGTNLKEKLNVVQEAMKMHYATQCGFCTPGFVVSLTGFSLSENSKEYEQALDAISGNICRCTGYKSIEKAACEVSKKVKENPGHSMEWLIENNFIPGYFSEIPERLKSLTIPEKSNTSGPFVAGGTDLYVQRADQLIDNPVTLTLNREELKGITIDKQLCTVGAGNTVSDLWNHSELLKYFPKLRTHLKLVSSEQIRNMATLGGNLVNASPIGDMTLFFMALDSTLTLTGPESEERTLPLKLFYKGYKTMDLNKGELIKNLSFKLPEKTGSFNFEKVSKRTHLDIASVNSAALIDVQNGIVRKAHIAIGGVAAIPLYLHKTTAFLQGKPLNSELIAAANQVLQEEISPISDVRGSEAYKRLLARQLLYAHFTTLFPEQCSFKTLVTHA